MFFPSWKTIFKQPRHLLDTWPFRRDLKLFLIAISIAVLTAGGSIEKVPGPSIASRQLVDQSSFFDCVWWILPRHLSLVASVDVLFSRHLSRHLSRYLSTPLSVENYWGSIYRLRRDSVLIYLISLDLSTPIDLPNTFFSLKTFSPRDFQPSLLQITWYDFFFSHFFIFSCIWT